MREILFKGKRKDNSKWVEGSLVSFFKYKSAAILASKTTAYLPKSSTTFCTNSCYDVIPETVGQFTGLTDKNGKKIFDGDIILFGENTYQIIFECGSFALYDKHGEIIPKIGGINDHCYPLMNLHLECCWEENLAYDIEIVGNIHDNPELMKG